MTTTIFKGLSENNKCLKSYFSCCCSLDASVDAYPLMSSPAPLVSIFAIYLWFVLKAGPAFMKNRPPYNVTVFVRLYNIFQVCACIYFVITFQNFGYAFKYTWKCAAGAVPIPDGMIITGFLYLLLRLIEFIETVVFILRKKQNQVSLLHLYHHISTVAVFWLYYKYSFGEFLIYRATEKVIIIFSHSDVMEMVMALFNTYVHIFMYSYYFLSSFNQMQKFTNPVKRYLTAIQITQLFVILGQCAVAILPGCNASKIFYVQFIVIVILIFLFSQFYFKTYLKKRK